MQYPLGSDYIADFGTKSRPSSLEANGQGEPQAEIGRVGGEPTASWISSKALGERRVASPTSRNAVVASLPGTAAPSSLMRRKPVSSKPPRNEVSGLAASRAPPLKPKASPGSISRPSNERFSLAV